MSPVAAGWRRTAQTSQKSACIPGRISGGSFAPSYTFNNFELDTAPPTPMPEPGTMLMLATGLAGAAVRYRRGRAAGQTA